MKLLQTETSKRLQKLQKLSLEKRAAGKEAIDKDASPLFCVGVLPEPIHVQILTKSFPRRKTGTKFVPRRFTMPQNILRQPLSEFFL